MGFEVKKKCLLPIAVPTIHFAGAIIDRRRCQDNDSPTSRPSQPKKMRSAYRKRECSRVVEHHYCHVQYAATAQPLDDQEINDAGNVQEIESFRLT